MALNMAELWDIYDRNRVKTGRTIERGKPMESSDYHIVVNVWLQNPHGEWLISKRTPNKTFPNMWECTGGSVLAGEDSLTAAVREVGEELGIRLRPEDGRLFTSLLRQNHRFPDFLDVWFFGCDCSLDDVILQKDETCGAMWATSGAILEMIENGIFIGRKVYPYLDGLLRKD